MSKHIKIFDTLEQQDAYEILPCVSILSNGTNLKYHHKKVYKFAGLKIAPGPLYYNGSSYEIKDSWNYDSYDSVYGKNSGSYYFNFLEMGELFEKSGFSTSDGSIENTLNPLNNWRLPTQTEWDSIVGTTRTGSTVNGNTAHCALIQLTGVTHAGSSIPNGLLIFPDGETIIGKSLNGIDNITQTTGVTLVELNVYLNQGCIFLPASGYYDNGDWYDGGSGALYWSSTEINTNDAYDLYFDDGYISTDDFCNESGDYFTVRLVQE
ncbi:MAG: hypothetical protein IJH39_09255 [Clostridia bacterium]|nr:hypothetical protein [Clostridia bacterium]